MITQGRFLRTVALLLAVTFGLVSCKTVRDADYTVNVNQQKLQRIQARSTERGPVVVNYPGYYVNPNPVALSQSPLWLKRKITLRAQSIPLNLLVAQILRNTPATISYQSGINQYQPIKVNYSGTIKGALDAIGNTTNYAYQVQGNQVQWQAFVTKTFNIAFMPGTSSYAVGQTAGGSAVSTSPSPGQSASGSAGSGSNIVTPGGQLGGQQYSSLEGQLSVWEDLTNTLNDLKSSDGRVSVSQSTSSVTVYDHPQNVNAMAQYINELNDSLSREVAIQVEVLEIDLNRNFNFGIDWNMVQQVLGTPIKTVASLASSTSINPAAIFTPGTTATNNGLAIFQIGGNNSNAIINALSTQGKVSVVTQPRVVTMNDQMASIRITTDTSYLQSVTSTTAVNAGSTSSLTPGIFTTGFSLYLLPRIKQNDVYLQISSSLSTLDALNSVTNAPAGADVSQNNANAPAFQQIQVPTISEKHFNQRTVVSSGSTLVIAGFQQTRDEVRRAQMAGIQALGSTGAARQNTQLIVLITPTILGKY